MTEMLTEKQRKILAAAVADIETVLVQLQRENPVDKMTKLRDKQSRFALLAGAGILKACAEGYEPVTEDFKAITGHMAGSLHYSKLACDLSLFRRGLYLTNTEDYKFLGEWWERFGGSWGGRFNDGNHFSISHGGKK